MEEEFEIAKEIIGLRKKANLTQKQFAEMAGTSQPAITRMKSGKKSYLILLILYFST